MATVSHFGHGDTFLSSLWPFRVWKEATQKLHRKHLLQMSMVKTWKVIFFKLQKLILRPWVHESLYNFRWLLLFVYNSVEFQKSFTGPGSFNFKKRFSVASELFRGSYRIMEIPLKRLNFSTLCLRIFPNSGYRLKQEYFLLLFKFSSIF